MRLNPQLTKTVRGFTGRRILVIGDVMLDRYWQGEVERISPEAPVPVVRKMRSFGVPGGAANTACNVAALGAAPVLVGITGRDEAGAELRRLLTERGIDCAGIPEQAERPTTVKLRIVAHNQQVVRVDEEETGPIDDRLSGEVVKRAGVLIRECDGVVVSDYAKGFLTGPVMRGVIRASRREGKPVVVDPKGADLERYRGATVIKPNRHELSILTGLPAGNHVETVRAAGRLLRRMGSGAVVVTEGKDGMTLFRQGSTEEWFPSFAREVYDVTGAGDTALAALAVALAGGADLRDAVWLSNLAAGLAVGQPGTVAVSREQVEKALAGVGERKPRAG